MKKRYYICITPFFPEPGLFRGPYVLDQVKALSKVFDYDVIVMKPCPVWKMQDDYEYDGIRVYRFKDYSVPSNMFPNRMCDWLTSKSLVSKLRAVGVNVDDIEVAHAHVTKQGACANYLKTLNPNIRTVVQHHGFDVMSVGDGRWAKYKFHEDRCIKHGVRICNSADINIGVSQKTLDFVLKQPGVKLKNQYVLYNGVDTSIFRSQNQGTTPNSEQHRAFTIGCIGNFWELKDQKTLIKAVEQLVDNGVTDIKTVFIGTGYTLDSCKQYVQEHKLNKYFEFRTEVMHDKLPVFYSGLDLFVLPSYYEAFGCVYTEAYACGVPFIGVKGQGIAEIIPENDAEKWLINKGDFDQLAKLICQYRDSHPKQNLSCDYDINKLISNYINFLYKDI